MQIYVSKKIEDKLRKDHSVTEKEVRECLLNIEGKLLKDTREKNATTPPTQWFVASTNKGRVLKVCIIIRDGVIHIKTAYDANSEEIRIYNTYGY